MYKQVIKSILLTTVATFSISASAKPVPKNATPDQIMKGIESGIYSSDEVSRALQKKQPNVLGYFALTSFMMKHYDSAYTFAKEASAKNNALGKFVEGYSYALGTKRYAGLSEEESNLKGAQLMAVACKDNSIKKSSIDFITGGCRAVAKYLGK